MPLRLVRKDETFEQELAGTVLRCRYLSRGEMDALRRAHTKNMRLDEQAYSDALWGRVLVGWDRLVDADDKAVPCEPERQVDFADPLTGKVRPIPLAVAVAYGLPDEVAELLLARARWPVHMAHEALGNLSPSSSSGVSSATERKVETPSTESSPSPQRAAPASTSSGS